MCWYCGSPIQEEGVIGRSALCFCGKSLRSCRNCTFYLPDSSGKCKETQAESISDKEKSNFCDYFSVNPRFRSQTAGEKNSLVQDQARKDFEKLFGG